MTIETFIITIQWGKGMHYIVNTCKTFKRATELIDFHKKRCDTIHIKANRGAKATIRSWQLVEESK